MYVGIFGDVIFSVGHLRVLTPSNFKGTTGANWAEHEVLGGKARAEYLSPKLREYTFDILLDAHITEARLHDYQPAHRRARPES